MGVAMRVLTMSEQEKKLVEGWRREGFSEAAVALFLGCAMREVAVE